MRTLSIRAAALAALVLAPACTPPGEPIVAPVPEGPAGNTAPRPLVQTVPVSQEFSAAVQAGTRTATGVPGPRYWQQRVRYTIEAELNPGTREVTGKERIVYHNRSPNSLRFVVFNLYQNLFRGPVAGESPFNTGGFKLSRVAAQGQALSPLTAAQAEANLAGTATTAGYIEQGTLARMYLPRALAPGDSTVFEVDFSFRVPPAGAPRTGWEEVPGVGIAFQVAQWYPQIATYDDVVGPDVTQYTGQGEFYLEYGDFDFSVTVPDGWLVTATGTLQNADQVLSAEVRQRLQQAMQTDQVVRVVERGGQEAATTAGSGGKVTWRFQAQGVRDVAFATSNRYVWDATRAVVPAEGGGTRNVAVHALYRPGSPHWENAARHGDHSTEYLSRVIIPYLYPQISVVEGPIYGMEYPMLVFIGRPNTEQGLYEVIAHEVAHEWFPMMVGQDEALAPWMDEGLTTFHEALAFNDFFPGEQHFDTPRQAYMAAAGRKGEAPLSRHADALSDAQLGVAAYYKPGTLLRSLRAVLGDSVFHRGMREYANTWLLKHPYPWDFFNTMERVSGRELDWFFHPWFFTTATMDLAVDSVGVAPGSVTVRVRDLGQVPGPAIVAVTTRDGRTVTQTIPIERFLDAAAQAGESQQGSRVAEVTIPVTGDVARVVLDPERLFPDVNERNDTWNAPGR